MLELEELDVRVAAVGVVIVGIVIVNLVNVNARVCSHELERIVGEQRFVLLVRSVVYAQE